MESSHVISLFCSPLLFCSALSTATLFMRLNLYEHLAYVSRQQTADSTDSINRQTTRHMRV
jgi:hypothetical protein